MIATLLKTEEHPSQYSGNFFYAYFKGDDGKSYRSCLWPKMGNFLRWKPYIGRENVVLDGLNKKTDYMIDADSFPRELKGA